MKVYIVQVGNFEKEILLLIKRGVEEAFFHKVTCIVLSDKLQLPNEAYNHVRRQYISEVILNKILEYSINLERERGERCIVLGVTDVDIYSPGMNFIFGEANCPGKAAIISLFRLRPEFYGEEQNDQLFIERSIKEAVHELGHVFGLRHCKNPFCVMYFSLHIGMTDRKMRKFCEECMIKLRNLITKN